MKVLHVMASGEAGGGADHLVGLLPALKALNVKCEVAVGSHGPTIERLRSLGIVCHAVDLMCSRFDAFAPVGLAKCVRRVKPRLVHFHGTRAAFFGPLVPPHAECAGMLYTAHGLSCHKGGIFTQAIFRGVERRIAGTVDAVISVAQSDHDELAPFARAAHHIPNAVDANRFSSHHRNSARLALTIPDDVKLVGAVSRLVKQKAVAVLVEAMLDAPDAHLVVIGEGPLRPSLERQIDELGLSKRVHLLGQRDDVEALLPAFDLFALSSAWEGEPIVLLEAMAAGVACVATETAGAREILEPSGAGQLVAIGDAKSFGLTLAQLLSDDTMRLKMSQNGREAVAKRTYEACAERVFQIYRELHRSGTR